MAEGHELGPGQCQRPGESGGGKEAFKLRLTLGKALSSLWVSFLICILRRAVDQILFQGLSGSEKFCDNPLGTLAGVAKNVQRMSSTSDEEEGMVSWAIPWVRATFTSKYQPSVSDV